jgi:hypothetical protein
MVEELIKEFTALTDEEKLFFQSCNAVSKGNFQ